jgi:hypothetical protein
MHVTMHYVIHTHVGVHVCEGRVVRIPFSHACMCAEGRFVRIHFVHLCIYICPIGHFAWSSL